MTFVWFSRLAARAFTVMLKGRDVLSPSEIVRARFMSTCATHGSVPKLRGTLPFTTFVVNSPKCVLYTPVPATEANDGRSLKLPSPLLSVPVVRL